MTGNQQTTATTARDAIAGALADFAAAAFPKGMRPGDGDPDWECPWEMNELGWPDFADAVLFLLRHRGVRLLCGAEYRDPIGAWATCERPAFHEGEHDGDDFAWPDGESFTRSDSGSTGDPA